MSRSIHPKTCPACEKAFLARYNQTFCSYKCSNSTMRNGAKNKTHGMHNSKTYRVWDSMKRRCLSQRHPEFKHYGARGITICDKWFKFEGFLEDMGEQPAPRYSIERVDVNGNYHKENCKWIPVGLQQRNKRNTTRIMFQGELRPVSDVYDMTSPAVSFPTFWARVKAGWPLQAAISIPTIKTYPLDRRRFL